MLRQGLQATVTRSDSSETRASPCGDWGVGGGGRGGTLEPEHGRIQHKLPESEQDFK